MVLLEVKETRGLKQLGCALRASFPHLLSFSLFPGCCAVRTVYPTLCPVMFSRQSTVGYTFYNRETKKALSASQLLLSAVLSCDKTGWHLPQFFILFHVCECVCVCVCVSVHRLTIPCGSGVRKSLDVASHLLLLLRGGDSLCSLLHMPG